MCPNDVFNCLCNISLLIVIVLVSYFSTVNNILNNNKKSKNYYLVICIGSDKFITHGKIRATSRDMKMNLVRFETSEIN